MAQQFHFQPLQSQIGGAPPSYGAVDEAYYDGVSAGFSFRSLLSCVSLLQSVETHSPLKSPKTEPIFTPDDGVASVTPPRKVSKATSSSPLPFQPTQNTVPLDSPMVNPRSGKAPYKQPRKLRQSKLNEKTTSLRQLLPRGEKMDMATVLEEAHKYIKFLEAQVSVLQSMPCKSAGGGSYGADTSVGGEYLAELSRQQLLQAVIESPVAQTKLYSTGCCLYSVEQVVLLKQKAERRRLRLRMILGSANPNSFLY